MANANTRDDMALIVQQTSFTSQRRRCNGERPRAVPGLGPSPDDGGTAQISACRSDYGARPMQIKYRLKVGWQVYSDSAHRLVSASHRICVGARRGMTTRVRSYGGDGDTTRWRAQESPWKHGQTHTNTNFYARPHCEASDWERPSRTTPLTVMTWGLVVPLQDGRQVRGVGG